MESVSEKILLETAAQLFGEARAELLRAEIARTAEELANVEKHVVTFEDEL
jgi:hypothetical protein